MVASWIRACCLAWVLGASGLSGPAKMWRVGDYSKKLAASNLQDLHVFSIAKPAEASASSSHKRVWRWKEAVMGVGHDQFEAKPKTTRRLVETVALFGGGVVDEVVVLANCARLEIYVASPASGEVVAACAAAFLDDQVSSWQDQGGEVGVGALLSFMDRPSLITEPSIPFGGVELIADMTFQCSQIAAAAITISGSENVARHLSLIAVGLPTGRAYNTFSPFSSRDAHILLQLKRVLEYSSNIVSPSGFPPPCRARLGTLFRGALSAGKAARDPSIVPEINALRFTWSATAASAAAAAEGAVQKAVDPTISRIQAELLALDQGNSVVALREKARVAVDSAIAHAQVQTLGSLATKAVASAVGRKLHAPTMALRRGVKINETDVLEQVVAAALSAVGSP